MVKKNEEKIKRVGFQLFPTKAKTKKKRITKLKIDKKEQSRKKKQVVSDHTLTKYRSIEIKYLDLIY